MSGYLVYLTALAHGMFAGTDTKNKWIFLMYVTTFSTILVLMTVQAILAGGGKKASVPSGQTTVETPE